MALKYKWMFSVLVHSQTIRRIPVLLVLLNSTFLLCNWVAGWERMLRFPASAHSQTHLNSWQCCSFSNISSSPKTKLCLLHSVKSCAKTVPGIFPRAEDLFLPCVSDTQRFLNTHSGRGLKPNFSPSLNYEHSGNNP